MAAHFIDNLMTTIQTPLRLGTRGSPLARAQTRMVQEAIIHSQPALIVETVVIKTSGDQWAAQATTDPGLPSDKGMFTKELEESLLAGKIDLAIHSLKDLPVEFHSDLVLAAVLPRANPQDVLISREPFPGWDQLPAGAILATGSLRRAAQLRMVRPDLKIVDIRGNIDTRLRKLRENPAWYGIVLAAAGIDRLGPDLTNLLVTLIDFSVMLPAPGQGVIALQGRRTDLDSQSFVQSLHCSSTQTCALAERAFLQALGGGCRAPVGAHASISAGRLQLAGVYFPDPHQAGQRGLVEGLTGDAESLGQELAGQLSPA